MWTKVNLAGHPQQQTGHWLRRGRETGHSSSTESSGEPTYFVPNRLSLFCYLACICTNVSVRASARLSRACVCGFRRRQSLWSLVFLIIKWGNARGHARTRYGRLETNHDHQVIDFYKKAPCASLAALIKAC